MLSLNLSVSRHGLSAVAAGLLTLSLCGVSLAAPYLDMPNCRSVTLSAEDLNAGKEQRLVGNVQDAGITLGRGHPNGVLLAADFGKTVEAIEIPEGMEGFEDGEFVAGSLEMGLCGLTGDGVPELLLASGDNAALLTVAVFVYMATAAPRWNLVGMIEGQSTLQFADGHVRAPYGGQGLYDEYTVTADGVHKKP